MNRPLLLDTCAAIWLAEDAALSEAAVSALDAAADRGESLYVSPYTAWEIGMLVSRRRLSIAISPQQWFRRLLGAPLIRLAEMTPDILIAASFLPSDTLRDPADKVIVATAREMGLTIVTRDQLILDYAGEGHVGAVAC
ncbi:type II toxin-antitoxin system VapC family toxin [Asticcacaulis sp. EMRT-3]|uniref:type II toxin-antitoxin system VapC family toxin n=1 Tax=Asticcacaulis sp. EMRT-3 TaxID=3040349 RepID=UPI0024AF8ACD|nr:type II toxin-antitoxin system VapC family toxin [Asticcacaulis sp. EMRT-3]MDI7775034.1 type II toxin-antitoxin system VapC family toxin [Asticcacaulis sp. EMRT-3]